MNRWVKLSITSLVIVLWSVLMGKSGSVDAATLKALIVNGQNNHCWQTSSPILKQILEQTYLFKVDVATSPPKGSSMEGFKPDFAGYDVVVLDYNGDLWPEQTRRAFVDYVRSGGGVVVYHAADNSFPEWKEYNKIIGLGGWRGRDEKSGPYVRWRNGKVMRDMSPGRGGSHGPRHAFQVIIRNKEHPITAGLPIKWMHAEDELYSQLRGPAENLTVLATAYADPKQKGTGEHELILFSINYGEGRVFHTVLGHVGRGDTPLPAMECAGFITTFQRGAEWAATGKVTQKIPEDFPTATEVRTWKNYRPPKSLEELLPEVAKYEYGRSRQPLTELEDLIRSASDSPKRLKQIEKSLLKFLRSDATPAAKQFICRKLSIIGTKESVPALAAMLTEKATSSIEPSDMARYALERIPGAAVDKALRDALGKTSGRVKVGIINSLGERGDGKAVKQLGKLLANSDKEVAEAAIAALGKIGGRKAAGALAKAKSKVGPQLHPAWADAYLKCADKFSAKGSKKSAIKIYKQLYVPDEPAAVRVAAFRGMVNAAPKKAVGLVVDVLKGDDEVIQAAAIGLFREIPGEEMTQAVIAELANLSVLGQVQAISALGDRGDLSALPAVIESTKSSEADVRVAAFGAIGVLGNASNVGLLAEAAAAAEGAEQQAAREGLYRLRGPEVDEKILAGFPQADAKVRVELVRSIGERNMAAGVRTLLKTARDKEKEVRLESFKALKVVAEKKDLPALVGLLIRPRSETDRSEAENTVAAVARKIEDKDRQAETILVILPMVEQGRARCSILRVLGKIGGSGALDALRKALEDSDVQVRTAAIRALSDWPDDEPINDLLKVAQSSDDERHRIIALRGFVRLIGLDSSRPAEQMFEMYSEAMELAPKLDEKKMVLSGLANVKSFAALQMAAGYLEDKALQQEAEAAVVRIAESTQAGYAQQTKAVLGKVIQISENDSLRQQAQKLIEQIERFEDYITEWQVSGPYTKDDTSPSALFDVVFGPEEKAAADVEWRVMPAGTDKDKPWLMELDKAIGGGDRVAYLRTRVWSPKEEKVRLEVGSNDGIKVWLNDKVVHSNNVMRTVTRDEDRIDVTLREGWNKLMLKITQSGGTWSACACLRALDGGKLEGLKVQAEGED